jgi:signal transduction histidine kinase
MFLRGLLLCLCLIAPASGLAAGAGGHGGGEACLEQHEAEYAEALQSGRQSDALAALVEITSHHRSRGEWAQALEAVARGRRELGHASWPVAEGLDIALAEANALMQLDRLDEAFQVFAEVRQRARLAEDPLHEAQALVGLSSVQSRSQDFATSWQLAEEARTVARMAGSAAWEARAVLRQANVALNRDQNSVALALVKEAAVLPIPADDPEAAQTVMVSLAIVGARVGADPEVLAMADQVVATAKAHGHGYILGFGYEAQGSARCQLGQPEQALASFDLAAAQFDPATSPFDAARVQASWADCLARLGRHREAFEREKRSREWYAEAFEKRRVEAVESLSRAFGEAREAEELARARLRESQLAGELETQTLRVWLVVAASAVLLLGLLASVYRLREMRAERASAQAAQQARVDLLAMAGHEIRNPAQGLSAALSALDDVMLDAPRRRTLATARHAADVIARLSRDVFDLALAEQQRLVVSRRLVAPADLVASAVALLRPAADAKGLVLLIDERTGGERAEIDPERATQVLVNLLSNAVRYTSEGSIVVRSEWADGAHPAWRCAVSDTGPGIPEAEMGRIFDPYYRGSTRIRGEGGGLGLAVVQHIIEAHGGQVGVRNCERGGACFQFEIPVDRREPADSVVVAAAPPDLAGMRILIVDDDEDVRLGVAAMAEAMGATVETASGGAEAESRLRLQPFGVILLDLYLGEERGEDLLPRLRALAPSTRLLLMTGSVERAQAPGGFDAVLIKPFGREALLAAARPAAGSAGR